MKYNRLASQIDAWEDIQIDKEKKNDRRAILIIASMCSFYASIGAIVISFIVAIYYLWK